MKIQEKLELISNANNFKVEKTDNQEYSIYYKNLVAVIAFNAIGWKETDYYISGKCQ